MILNQNNVILLVTAIVTGLMAGLFYNWTTAITLGLGQLSDREYLTAFQAINRSIQNPLFFMAFFGAALMLPICTYIHYKQPVTMTFYYLLGATVLYLGGVMVVTILGNIPLNNGLDKFDLQNASLSDIAQQRRIFENPWNILNTIRTVSSFLSLVLVLLACLSEKLK
jgi:uncharacterized membrane protein